MRVPPEETARNHENMLVAASRLFRERGFVDVSVAKIMKAIGLTHGPFYNHFASKRDLVAKSIAHASAATLDALASTPGTNEGRDAYISGYLSRAHCEAPGEGCLMAALAAEAGRDPEARSAFTRHLSKTIARFGAHFPWKKAAKGEDAILALAAMVGGVVLARASSDDALGDEILTAVRSRLVALQA